MGRSAWRDWIAPDEGEGEVALADRPEPRPDAPREAGIYFGCQLGWSPAREGRDKLAVEWACDLATRDVLIVELCPECLSGFGDITLGDRVVCAGCLRYSRDDRVAALLEAERREAEAGFNPNNVGVEKIRFHPKGS